MEEPDCFLLDPPRLASILWSDALVFCSPFWLSFLGKDGVRLLTNLLLCWAFVLGWLSFCGAVRGGGKEGEAHLGEHFVGGVRGRCDQQGESTALSLSPLLPVYRWGTWLLPG